MDERQWPEEPEPEVVDGLPVIAEVREIASAPVLAPPALVPPAVQAAVVAATGFVAGAATLALLHRRSARRLPGAGARGAPPLPLGGATRRTYLVHVISRPLD